MYSMMVVVRNLLYEHVKMRPSQNERRETKRDDAEEHFKMIKGIVVRSVNKVNDRSGNTHQHTRVSIRN